MALAAGEWLVKITFVGEWSRTEAVAPHRMEVITMGIFQQRVSRRTCLTLCVHAMASAAVMQALPSRPAAHAASKAIYPAVYGMGVYSAGLYGAPEVKDSSIALPKVSHQPEGKHESYLPLVSKQ